MNHETWTPLGAADPSKLTEARLQLHYATQLVAAVGRALAPAQEDDSHTSLRWDPLQRLLLGVTLHEGRSFRAGLNPETLKLVIVEAAGVAKVFPLDGKTTDEGLAWLRDVLGSNSIVWPTYPEALPSHDLDHGGTFSATSPGGGKEERAELVRYFDNTHRLLEKLTARHNVSPVRLWPHHFDLATMVTLKEEGATLGLGISPGDRFYPEPYWYATPTPAPADLPTLEGDGVWHTEEWTGGVLAADNLLTDGRAQLNQVRDFFSSVARAFGSSLT